MHNSNRKLAMGIRLGSAKLGASSCDGIEGIATVYAFFGERLIHQIFPAVCFSPRHQP
jgi:hypothetical protein